MASKFVVALALFAVCASSPVDELRAKRSFTVAQGYSSQYGKNSARAAVSGNNANAEASNDDSHLARDGLVNPGQVYVKTYNSDSEPAHYGYAQPAYYPVPAPATVVAYQKYADVPAELPAQIVYEAPVPSAAHSSATTNGGYGSVNANANSGLGAAASNAAADGTGQSVVSSNAHSSGLGLAEPAVIAAKHQGYYSAYTPYSPATASANANANTYGHQSSANAAAKSGAVPTRKSISWHFGTAYDQPAAYGAAKAAAANYAYNAPAPAGALRSSASTANFGVAQSSADNHAVRSAASSNLNGIANADASNNGGTYAVLRTDNGYAHNNGITSSASTHNGGAAASQAQIDAAGREIVHSAAKSGLAGSAQSVASSNGGAAGLRAGGAWGGRTVSNAYSKGEANAASSAHNQGLSAGYRVVNTHANSGPYGSAGSNAYTL